MVVVHAFCFSTREAEAGRLLWVSGQSGLHSTAKPCLNPHPHPQKKSLDFNRSAYTCGKAETTQWEGRYLCLAKVIKSTCRLIGTGFYSSVRTVFRVEGAGCQCVCARVCMCTKMHSKGLSHCSEIIQMVTFRVLFYLWPKVDSISLDLDASFLPPKIQNEQKTVQVFPRGTTAYASSFPLEIKIILY